MRVLKTLLTALLCATLLACEKDQSPSPTPGAIPRGESNPPQGPVRCESYEDFVFAFRAMKVHSADLSAQPEDANRLALASALFAEYLLYTYSSASTMRDGSVDLETQYLKYFSLIFTKEGQVRTSPAHPLTKYCQKKE